MLKYGKIFLIILCEGMGTQNYNAANKIPPKNNTGTFAAPAEKCV